MHLEAYSLKTIQTVLEVAGLRSIKAFSSIDQKTEFDVYFRIFQGVSELNFLKDTIDYFLLTQGQGSHRRMAFIFDHPDGCYAMLIQTLNFNHKLAKDLMKRIQVSADLKTTESIATSSLWNNFRHLYEHVQVHFLLQHIHEPCIQTILKSLPMHYEAKIVTTKQLLNDHTGHELTEHMLTMLKEGKISTSKESLIKKHHQLCAKAIEPHLTLLHDTRSADYFSLIETLRILVKYTLLTQQRQLFTLPIEDNFANEILNTDKTFKRIIFAMPFDTFRDILPYLSINTLTQLFTLRDNFTQTMQFLNHQKMSQYHMLTHWEHTLKQQAQHYSQSWSSWGWQKISFVGHYFHQRSFIGIVEGISEWIGIFLIRKIDTKASWFVDTKNLVKACVQLSVFFLTFSPALAKRVSGTLDTLFTPKGFPLFTKTLGTTLGLLYAYSTEIMSTFPMIGLIFMAERTRALLKTEHIDMTEARVISNESYVPSLNVLIRAWDLILASFNTWFASNPEYVLRSASSTSMGIVFTRIIDKMLTELSEDPTLKQQDKDYLRFLMNTVGMQLGSTLFAVYVNIAKKLAVREKAVPAIDIKVPHQIEFPNLVLSPSLWFNEDNPFTLSWSTESTVHHASCHIVNARNTVECTTTLSSPRSLKVEML